MRLEKAFYRLPISVDLTALQREVLSFPEQAWQSHPTGFPGNSALILVSAHGQQNDDFSLAGPMQATPALKQSPALQAALRSLRAPLARCRLMRLAPGSGVPQHDDRNYYWSKRVRVHMPIFTEPCVRFTCGEEQVHMPAGSVFTFDNFRPHSVSPPEDKARIHLVADTLGSPAFWSLLQSEAEPALPYASLSGAASPKDAEWQQEEKLPGGMPALEPYRYDIPSPTELCELTQQLREHTLWAAPKLLAIVQRATEQLERAYAAAFERYGASEAGDWLYRRVCFDFRNALPAGAWQPPLPDALLLLRSLLTLTNRSARAHPPQMEGSGAGQPLRENAAPERRQRWLRARWFELSSHGKGQAVRSRGGSRVVGWLGAHSQRLLAAVESTPQSLASVEADSGLSAQAFASAWGALSELDLVAPEAALQAHIHSPLFIVSAPRAGSSMLFELLSCAQELYSLPGESHRLIEGIEELHPASSGFASNRLTPEQLSDGVRERLALRFSRAVHDRDGRQPRGGSYRLLEKTPKNSLRVAMLAAAFPDARFIFLHRAPAPSIASLLEGWRSGRFVTYPQLADWQGMPWSFVLVEGWRQLPPDQPARIAATQWRACNEQALADLQALAPQAWCSLSYEELCADPSGCVQEIAAWAGLDVDDRYRDLLQRPPALSSHTLSAPHPHKWHRYRSLIEPVLAPLEPLAGKLRALRRFS